MTGSNTALLKRVIERDGLTCAWCGETPKPGSQNPPTLDHVDPNGGSELENLQMLCLRCNAQKGAGVDEKTVRFHSKVEQAGFTIMPNVVLLDPRLSVGAKVTYLALRYYARQDEFCWPGQGGLASKLGVTEKTLRGYIAELVDLKLVAAKRRGRGETNFYVILSLTGYFPSGQHVTAEDKNGNSYRSEPGESTGLDRSKLPTTNKQEKKTQQQPAANAAGEAASPPRDQLGEQVERLCGLMSTHVRSSHGIAASSREARVTKGWRDACRALLTLDVDPHTGEHFTPKQVEYAIAWVCRHHYWRNRVKSMTRLRSEMQQVASDIRKAQAGGGQLSSTDGLSASQRARLHRTEVRLARARQDQPPPPHQIGGSDGNDGIDVGGGAIGREDRQAQPALAG